MSFDPKRAAGIAFIWVDNSHPNVSHGKWVQQLQLTGFRRVGIGNLTPKMQWRLEEVQFQLSEHYHGTKIPSVRLFDSSSMIGVYSGVCTKACTPAHIKLHYADFCLVKEALEHTLGDSRFKVILLTFQANPQWEQGLPYLIPLQVLWPPRPTDSFNLHDMKSPVYPGTYHIYGPSMGKFKKMTPFKAFNIASTEGMQPSIHHNELSEQFDYDADELQKKIVLEYLLDKHFFDHCPQPASPNFAISPLANGIICAIGPIVNPDATVYTTSDVWETIHMELEYTFFRGVFHITVLVDENRIPHVKEWTEESTYSAEETATDGRKVKARIENKTKWLKVDEFAAEYYDAHIWKFPRNTDSNNYLNK